MSPAADGRDARSGVAFAVGAGAYALLQGPLGVDFVFTPLLVGLVAIVAGAVSTRKRAVATGLVLAGWGTAVLLVDRDIVDPARTAPVFMLGVATGLLAAAVLAPRDRRGEWLTSGAIAAFTGSLGFYLVYDFGAAGRWPAWAVSLLAVAGWELYWGLRPAHEPPRSVVPSG